MDNLQAEQEYVPHREHQAMATELDHKVGLLAEVIIKPYDLQ